MLNNLSKFTRLIRSGVEPEYSLSDTITKLSTIAAVHACILQCSQYKRALTGGLNLHSDGGGVLVAKLCLTLLTPWTVAFQAPLSMGFSRQEYWSGFPFPSSGELPDPGIKLGSLHCRQTLYWLSCKFNSVTQSCPTLCNPREDYILMTLSNCVCNLE